MKVISAKVLDPTHLELSQPIAATSGTIVEISIVEDDEDDRLRMAATNRAFLSAYDSADSIYDDL